MFIDPDPPRSGWCHFIGLKGGASPPSKIKRRNDQLQDSDQIEEEEEPTEDEEHTEAALLSVLQNTFGHAQFRTKEQQQAVMTMVGGKHDVFVSMPTGTQYTYFERLDSGTKHKSKCEVLGQSISRNLIYTHSTVEYNGVAR